MVYVIEAFYKDNELLAFEEELPIGNDQEIKIIMGWTVEQQGWEGYNLTSEQLGALESLLGKRIYDPAYLFQLSCNA